MFGSQGLETAVGLVLLFFVLATVVSALTEFVAQLTKKRARDLEKTVERLLNGETDDITKFSAFAARAKKFFPWIGQTSANGPPTNESPEQREAREMRQRADNALAQVDQLLVPQGTTTGLPAEIEKRLRVGVAKGSKGYLSAKAFAEAAVEVVTSRVQQDKGTPYSRAEQELLRVDRLAKQARGDLTKVKAGLEGWFDDAMLAASDAYKRWSNVFVFLAGLFLVGVLNASTIHVADDLWHNSATRSAVIEAADAAVQSGETGDCSAKTGLDQIQCSVDETQAFDLPLGWGTEQRWDGDTWSWTWWADGGLHVVGWLLTALLLMLGAPFWFDVLSRLTGLRATSAQPSSAARDPGSATTQVAAEAGSSAPSTRNQTPPKERGLPVVPDDDPHFYLASALSIPEVKNPPPVVLQEHRGSQQEQSHQQGGAQSGVGTLATARVGGQGDPGRRPEVGEGDATRLPPAPHDPDEPADRPEV